MLIPKIKLVPQPDNDEAKAAVGGKWNKEIGTRHFLGGVPETINGVNIPLCDDCKEPMTFYAQIDSIGDKYDLADGMVIHNYVCFDCGTVKCELVQI